LFLTKKIVPDNRAQPVRLICPASGISTADESMEYFYERMNEMDFSLTREQEMLKKLAQQFAETELEPMAEEIDREHYFPVENFKKMAAIGLTGIGVP
jgi:hypothetical protein